MATQPASDWIVWTGGECPVAPGTLVQIQYADETRERAELTAKVRADRFPSQWAHEARNLNIIAYRVVEQSK